MLDAGHPGLPPERRRRGLHLHRRPVQRLEHGEAGVPARALVTAGLVVVVAAAAARRAPARPGAVVRPAEEGRRPRRQ